MLDVNNNAATNEAPAAPDFQFPNLLKGDEINIPNTENNTNANTDASYLLQVGSFKNKDDAESFQRHLCS